MWTQNLFTTDVSLIGNQFGLDGIQAANGDRFKAQSLNSIRGVHSGQLRSTRGGDRPLQQFLINELSKSLCVKEWLSNLIGDINNQSANADRIIDRSCIFEWASKNMEGDFKHLIFYDEDRAEEYSDLDPKEPAQENQYEPFLSPVVLIKMLVKAGILEMNE